MYSLAEDTPDHTPFHHNTLEIASGTVVGTHNDVQTQNVKPIKLSGSHQLYVYLLHTNLPNQAMRNTI